MPDFHAHAFDWAACRQRVRELKDLLDGSADLGEAVVMAMQNYLKNRVTFPLDQLAKHRGEWVAWSPDGTRLVASSKNSEALDDLVRAAGENPEDCPIEGIPDTDCVVGGLDAP